MRRTHAILIAAFGLIVCDQAFAQTGQVPKTYSGQQSRPATVNQPRPTGQITPQVTGQPLGSLPQQNTSAPTQQVSNQVQDLGFEPKTNTQEGQVPKVTTNQDQRTMPERYQPGQATRAQHMVIETEVPESDNVNISVQRSGTANTQTTTTTTNGQPVNTSRPTQTGTKSESSTQSSGQGNTQSSSQPAAVKP